MIDLHAHILPCIDDGPATLEGSLELAATAVREGVTILAATPHVNVRYPTTADDMEGALASLRQSLEEARIDLRLLPGAEIALGSAAQLPQAELRRLVLGSSPYVLIEFPDDGWPLQLAATVSTLDEMGFRVVLAHPERNGEVQAAPERLRPLVDDGVLVQLTAPSLAGKLGRAAARSARQLLALELAHLVSSDAHALPGREFGLRQAIADLGDPRLGRWLAEDVPSAILEGADPPHRPSRTKRRVFRL